MNKAVILFALTAFLYAFTGSIPATASDIQPEQNTRLLARDVAVPSNINAQQMVVTAHPLATKAALDTLNQGGNAADAAIAAQLVLGLVEPQSSGLGGGAFALYFDAKTHKLYNLDARETAPQSATEDMFLNANGQPLDFFTASTSKKSIGLPGVPSLLFTLNQKFGDKSRWPDLFAPAISYAHNGFTVTPRLADSVAQYQNRLKKNHALPYFTKTDGSLIQSGDILRNAQYAETLSNYRDIGPKFITPHYRIKSRPNLCATYRMHYTICSMGEPSSGGLTLLYILRLLDGFDLGSTPNAEAYHLYLEASKLAFADRNHYMADPDFVDTPGKALIHPEYLNVRRALISVEHAQEYTYGHPKNWRGKYPPRHVGPDEGGTTHISIIDKYGNAISMTSSIEMAFGSGYMKDGYFLNNQLTDFSFIPEKDGIKVANRAEAGKRPRSSMSPTIVFDNNHAPIMVIGSAGGSRIIGYVAQRLIAMIDWGYSAEQALNMPAILTRGASVEVEQNFPRALETILRAKGHNIIRKDLNSGLTAIKKSAATYEGAADPRREGIAIGQ
ncbi:MAG: gamma-glutamyltransferase family protein [Alphaproteobacteria bacterium]|nr:gamma-glutamyltransferase family protein [Alphaproteobacteria bacterium]